MVRTVDYDHIAKTYDRRYQENDYSGVEAALIAFVGARSDQRILEVGCGTGHWLRSLDRAFLTPTEEPRRTRRLHLKVAL